LFCTPFATPYAFHNSSSCLTQYIYILAAGQCDSWSDWSAWTGCSRTCGTGMKSRTRRCDEGSRGTQDEMVGCVLVECPPTSTLSPVVITSTDVTELPSVTQEGTTSKPTVSPSGKMTPTILFSKQTDCSSCDTPNSQTLTLSSRCRYISCMTV